MTLRNLRPTAPDTTVKDKPKAAPAPANSGDKPMPTDAEMLEFLKAIDAFKRKTSRNFPSWTEALELLYDLGWRKVEPSRRSE
ncbi:MAG: hypothetical protein IPH13_07125 [Planctomycetes bacterium]|nr:hypothetical protein [Planctomycetota bacterium]MCC7170245.1 hypothetical protein [Planctomycetota bacterium]